MERIEVNKGRAYTCVVNAKALKMNVRIVVWYDEQEGFRIYFSTDTSMSVKDIIEYYKSRFQIEFAFRDVKQFTGLTHCQSRTKDFIKI